MRLTSSGWAVVSAAVVLVVTGAVLGYPELVALGLSAALLVPLAFGWLRSRGRLTARRTISPVRVVEGARAWAELTVTNNSRRASEEFEVTESVRDELLRYRLPGLPPMSTVEALRYELPAKRRGIYRVRAPRTETVDPMRLVRRRFPADGDSTLYVHPRCHRLVATGTGRLREVDGLATARRATGIAFHSVREYVPGDDRRMIHWMSTARLGRLVVRDNTVPDSPGHLVVLDVDQHRYGDASFEEAVRIAGSLCMAAGHGARVILRTTSGGQSPDGEVRAQRDMTPLLDFLAGVTPVPGDAVWSDLLRCDDGVGAAVVVTGRVDDAELDAIASSAPDLVSVSAVRVDPGAATVSSPWWVMTVATSVDFAQRWNEARQ